MYILSDDVLISYDTKVKSYDWSNQSFIELTLSSSNFKKGDYFNDDYLKLYLRKMKIEKLKGKMKRTVK